MAQGKVFKSSKILLLEDSQAAYLKQIPEYNNDKPSIPETINEFLGPVQLSGGTNNRPI